MAAAIVHPTIFDLFSIKFYIIKFMKIMLKHLKQLDFHEKKR